MKFENRVVWITGASSGIGESLAYEASSRGAYLILSARREEVLEQVKLKCVNPEKVKILPLDLENTDELNTKVDLAITLFGHIDILVNNGGISQRSLTRQTSFHVDERLMRINYLGSIALTKALLPSFLLRKRGQVVTVTSMVGKYGTPLRSSYAASKHALHGFMDSLRAEESSQGITITVICPGFVKTNVSVNALVGDGSLQGTMDKQTNKGIDPKKFAVLMANAIEKDKAEVYIAGLKEKLGLYLVRLCPALFRKLIEKMAVT